MLTIAPISSADYYLAHPYEAVDEYYVNGESTGHWAGKGAEVLGLRGEVSGDDVRAVLEARSPATGEDLLSPLARAARTRPGFDLTFSAPKGVSLIGLLGDRQTSEAVISAHKEAVSQALGYLEGHATFVRRGKDGITKLAGEGLVGAAFEHSTSRSGDPQLHTHLLAANLSVDGHGNWSSLDGRSLYRHSRTAGFIYQAALRAEMTRTLGTEWRPVQRGLAEPAGVGDDVLKHFSRRRAQIEEALEEAGASSARAGDIAARATRAPKDHDVDRAALTASWRLRAAHLGLDQDAPGPAQPRR